MSIFSRLWNALRPDHLDDELREELETHLAMAVEEERMRGLGPREAQALARQRFGSLSLYRGLTREVDLAAWLDDFRRDLAIGWRSLAGNAAITASALIALALGIGANTAIFSVVNANLIQPLPFGNAGRLVAVWQDNSADYPHVRFSARELLLWQQGLGVFEEIGGSIGNGFTLSGPGEPEALLGQLATPGLFDVLGRRPALGRTFLPAEGKPGHEHVVLLSDAWWRRRFAADPKILGRSLTLSGAGLIFGLAPALTALRTRLNEVLQQSARALTGNRGGRALRDALVWGETALCVVLLVAAGLLLRSILALERVDPGFRAENLVTASCAMRPSAYPNAAAMLRFYRGALDGIASQPGIAVVATTTSLPFSGQDWGNSFEILERPAPPREPYNAQFRAVSPGYFRAMGIPLLAGRELTRQDDARAPAVAVVNQAFARRYWPDGRAIGNHLRIAGDWRVIAGVVGDVHHQQLDIAPTTEVYLAYPQMDAGLLDLVGRGLYFAVRTALPAPAAGKQLRAAIHAVDRDMPVEDVRPMHDLLDSSVAEARFRALLIALFAGLAVALACVGIYGVVSYTVAQRAHEVGIQIALGATRRRVLTRVLTDTLKLVAPAAAAGLAAAWALSRFLAAFLFEVSTTDLATYALCPLAFIAIALAAAYAPALRAASVDPMTTLRQG